jgi:hypothetical protein
VVRIFSFFPSRVSPVFLREDYAGNITPCRVPAVVQITSFLPSVRELGFQIFDGGVGTLL